MAAAPLTQHLLVVDGPTGAVRRPRQLATAVEQLDLEAAVVLLAARQLADGVALSDDDRSRLRVAQLRIHASRSVFNG